MFRERDSWYAMSSAASSLRSSIRPSPAVASELAINSAALESPSAEMMAAFFCCSACEGGGRDQDDTLGRDGGLQPQKLCVRHPLWILNELWDFTPLSLQKGSTNTIHSILLALIMPTAHY